MAPMVDIETLKLLILLEKICIKKKYLKKLLINKISLSFKGMWKN